MKSPSQNAAGVLNLPLGSLSLDALLNKRVLQILGLYLAGAWPFFQFVTWLVDYYVLSPHLIELCLFTLAFMIPAVLLLAYTRGVRQFDHLTRVEMIGIPCNLAGVVVLLFVFFGGKDLGSAQQTVTMTTVEGDTVERVIPKSTFRKRVGLFFFDNATGEADNDWMRSGVPDALDSDLSQDLFITLKPAATFADRLEEVGFADGYDVPLALRRQIAEEYHLDYLLDGSVHRTDGGYRIETHLYATNSGKLLEERAFEGPDLLPLIDEASVQLKHDLDVPSKHIEETTDLPAAEVLTPSLPALEAYTQGTHAFYFEHDYARAAALLEEAVTEDATFAFAHLMRGLNFLLQGQIPRALDSYRSANQHSYRLPERYRFLLNTGILNLQNESDDALQSAQQWHTLYPDDADALEVLAALHTIRNERQEAIEARRKILQLDPSEQSQLLEIGDLLRGEGRYDEALEEYRRYVEHVPDKVDGYVHIGKTYQRMGDLNAEREAFRQALSLDASDPGIIGELADIELKLGNFDEAERQYERALELSRTAPETATAYNELANYRRFRGQLDAYETTMEEMWKVQATYLPPLQRLITKTSRAGQLARAGAIERARQLIAEGQSHPAAAEQPVKAIIELGEAAFLVEAGGAAEVPTILDELAATLEALGVRQDLGLKQLRAITFQKLERWEEAARAYEEDLEETPYNSTTWRRLGEVQHQMGLHEEAEAAFRQALKYYPTLPMTHLSLARLLLDLERTIEAREHLQQALAAWAVADEDFEPAQEARRLLDSLKA